MIAGPEGGQLSDVGVNRGVHTACRCHEAGTRISRQETSERMCFLTAGVLWLVGSVDKEIHRTVLLSWLRNYGYLLPFYYYYYVSVSPAGDHLTFEA